MSTARPLSAIPEPHSPAVSPPPRERRGVPWYTSSLLLGGILALGVGLRLVQYLANRPLWLDEAMLAMNILSRDYAGLLQRLESMQVAPAGFLLIEGLAVTTLGDSELVLRLFPLLAGIASLFLFLAVARQSIPAAAVPLALLLFATSDRLVYFSSEVKQYSAEVAVALLLLLLGFWIREKPVSLARATVLGVSGGAALWFSQPALFVLAGLGTSLLLLYGRARAWGELRRLLPALALWALIGIPALLLAMRAAGGEVGTEMRSFWQSGFMPLPPRSLAEALWLPNALYDLFGSALSLWPVAGVLLAAAGCLWALRRREDTLLLLLTPFFFALLASALQLYPFGGGSITYRPFHPLRARVLLYLTPCVILLVAAGAELLRQRLPGARVALLYLLLLLLVAPQLNAFARRFPYSHREDLRSLVAYVRTQWQPGDRIWVYANAHAQFQYYTRGDAPLREATEILHPELYALALPATHAAPVWVLLAYPPAIHGVDYREFVLRHLDRVATRCLEVRQPQAFLYLYHSGPPLPPSTRTRCRIE